MKNKNKTSGGAEANFVFFLKEFVEIKGAPVKISQPTVPFKKKKKN